MKKRKKFVQVGTGSRGLGFMKAMLTEWNSDVELAALCDANPGHLEYYNQEIVNELKLPALPVYSDRQFDRMIREHQPDVVLVTTRDCYHDKYIVRAMEMGCDAVTEKPMTTDEKKCQRIVDTVRRTGRDLRVTFNYRYSPPRTQVKDLLMKGVIGKVLSVDFQWVLNTRHGADYFRRWHRQRKNSGGLMVHKATHHFDLVNWWLGACPEEVFAMGSRVFYGPDNGIPEKYKLEGRAERCLECRHIKRCPFSFWQKRKPDLQSFYLASEKYDGYHRDQCVFSSQIDIEDSMNVVVRYNTGAFMTYSLNAFSPWEGYHIAFNGTRGRLEHDCVESVYVSGDGSVPGETIPQGTKIRIYPHFKSPKDIPVNVVKGGHGGGDVLLKGDMFALKKRKDRYLRAAGVASGAMSILTGVAANKSMKTGKPIKIRSLVKNIPEPEYPPMKMD